MPGADQQAFETAANNGEAVITEGALKADVIAEQLDCCVVAVAGVASFRDDFGVWLREQLPELRSVEIAFDSDWRRNKAVKTALLRLIKNLRAEAIEITVLDWDVRAGKGLDDVLSQEVTR